MAKRPTGKVLRDAREALGLSQSAIAEKLGITPAAVGHYEKGIAKPPLPRAQQLAKLLKVDVQLIPVSSRAARGSRKAPESGERVSAREAEVLAALRSMPLAKRRPAVEMILAYSRSA